MRLSSSKYSKYFGLWKEMLLTQIKHNMILDLGQGSIQMSQTLGAKIALSKCRRRELFVSAQNCLWLEKKLCCHFELFLPICATRCRQPEYFSTLSSRIRINEIL